MTTRRTARNTPPVTASAGSDRPISAPAAIPSATANSAYPIETMPWMSKPPWVNWLWLSAFSGAYHQVTIPATAPPKTAPASSSQPVLTDS